MQKLSQNFLIDPAIRDKIIEKANLQADDTVLEIGPGKGFLTKALLKKVKRVIAIEKDGSFIPILKNSYPKLELIHADFLDFPLETLTFSKVISNIPYHITKPLLLKLVEFRKFYHDAILMVQKEVAEKLIAKKPSSYFMAIMHFYFHTKILFEVPPPCFFPSPKINSAMVHLKINHFEDLPSSFFSMLKIAFSRKRKTLRSLFKKEMLPNVPIDKNVRAEDLSLSDFITLWESIFLN